MMICRLSRGDIYKKIFLLWPSLFLPSCVIFLFVLVLGRKGGNEGERQWGIRLFIKTAEHCCWRVMCVCGLLDRGAGSH